MGQWEPAQLATLGGLAIGMLFGGVAQATAFCSSGAILDFVRSSDGNRLRAWLLAIAVAIFSTQMLLGFEMVDLRKAVYLTAPLNLAGLVMGGLMFGIGMMLAQGCAARNLVRLGGGNLRAFVVVLVFAVVAYATMRGILAPGRVELERLTRVNLGAAGVPELLAGALGMAAEQARWIVAIGTAGALAVFCFANLAFRSSPQYYRWSGDRCTGDGGLVSHRRHRAGRVQPDAACEPDVRRTARRQPAVRNALHWHERQLRDRAGGRRHPRGLPDRAGSPPVSDRGIWRPAGLHLSVGRSRLDGCGRRVRHGLHDRPGLDWGLDIVARLCSRGSFNRRRRFSRSSANRDACRGSR